jgi:hypothetical protein
MTVLPAWPRTRAAGRVGVVLLSALVVLTASGCSDERHASATGIRYTVPTDFCSRLDYSIASAVYGEPTPTPWQSEVPTVFKTDNVHCSKLFQGRTEDGALTGGAATANVDIFATAIDARSRYDRPAFPTTVAPFPGGIDGPADAVRYRQRESETSVEILYGNLILQVGLATLGANSELGPFQELLPSTTAKFARNAFEALRRP